VAKQARRNRQLRRDLGRRLKPNEIMESAATAMLDQLLRWAEALRPLRAR
jgi:hypothetical protein